MCQELDYRIVQPTREQIENKREMAFYKHDGKECEFCGVTFYHGQKSRTNCCGMCKILITCNYCDKEFLYIKRNYSGTSAKEIRNKILNHEPLNLSCSQSCQNMTRKSYGTCPNCGHKDVKIYNSRCTYCANKELNASIVCPAHGFQERSFAGRCVQCHNSTLQDLIKDYKSGKRQKYVEKVKGRMITDKEAFWIDLTTKDLKQIVHKCKYKSKYIEALLAANIRKINHIEKIQKLMNTFDFCQENFQMIDEEAQKLKEVEFVEVCMTLVEYFFEQLEETRKQMKEFSELLDKLKREFNYDSFVKLIKHNPGIQHTDIMYNNKEGRFTLNTYCAKYRSNIRLLDIYNTYIIKRKPLSRTLSNFNDGLIEEPEKKVSKFEVEIKDKAKKSKQNKPRKPRYKTKPILTNRYHRFRGYKFIRIEGVLHYFDKPISVYIPWEEYKSKFQNNLRVLNNSHDSILQPFLDLGFKVFPTFLKSGAKTWANAKSAFERNLVEGKLKWICYIKLAKTEGGKLYPIVAGKTGSKLVNISGTDVCFSTDIKDGPARRYLADRSRQWEDSFILAKSFDKEYEAYEYEQQMLNEFKLFAS